MEGIGFMDGLLPDGPYYRCGARWLGNVPQCGFNRSTAHRPDKLRSIKGRWRCQACFAEGFGRDVLHEWDTAMTLADYLAAPV